MTETPSNKPGRPCRGTVVTLPDGRRRYSVPAGTPTPKPSAPLECPHCGGSVRIPRSMRLVPLDLVRAAIASMLETSEAIAAIAKRNGRKHV